MTIQAGVLLAAKFTADGEATAECIYYAIACRIAMLLDLVKGMYFRQPRKVGRTRRTPGSLLRLIE